MEDQTTLPPDTTQLPQNGRPKLTQLSSNTTLFWRVFLPIFGTVFLGGLAIAFLATPEDEIYLPLLPIIVWRGLMVALWLGWLIFVYRTIWRLKRLDADDTHLYASNYWTTLRYPWTDVTAYGETTRLGRRIGHFQLRAPGRFGPTLSFLPGSNFRAWWAEHGKERIKP